MRLGLCNLFTKLPCALPSHYVKCKANIPALNMMIMRDYLQIGSFWRRAGLDKKMGKVVHKWIVLSAVRVFLLWHCTDTVLGI